MKSIDSLIDILKTAKDELSKAANQSFEGDANGDLAQSDEPHKDDPKHEAKEQEKAKAIKESAEEILDMHKMCFSKSTGQWSLEKSMEDAFKRAGVKTTSDEADKPKVTPPSRTKILSNGQSEHERSSDIKTQMIRRSEDSLKAKKEKMFATHPTKGQDLHELSVSADGGDKAYTGTSSHDTFGRDSTDNKRLASSKTKLRRKEGDQHAVGKSPENSKRISSAEHSELKSKIAEWNKSNPKAAKEHDATVKKHLGLHRKIDQMHESGHLLAMNSSQRKKLEKEAD